MTELFEKGNQMHSLLSFPSLPERTAHRDKNACSGKLFFYHCCHQCIKSPTAAFYNQSYYSATMADLQNSNHWATTKNGKKLTK